MNAAIEFVVVAGIGCVAVVLFTVFAVVWIVK